LVRRRIEQELFARIAAKGQEWRGGLGYPARAFVA